MRIVSTDKQLYLPLDFDLMEWLTINLTDDIVDKLIESLKAIGLKESQLSSREDKEEWSNYILDELEHDDNSSWDIQELYNTEQYLFDFILNNLQQETNDEVDKLIETLTLGYTFFYKLEYDGIGDKLLDFKLEVISNYINHDQPYELKLSIFDIENIISNAFNSNNVIKLVTR